MFGELNKFIYLIQDYEPGFYNWSDNKVHAEATYLNSSSFIAIINSEELYSYMLNKYNLEISYCLPFEINKTLQANINLSVEKANQILVYARPGTERNLFGTIIEALKIFQREYTNMANEYQILFVGEQFSESLCNELYNYKIAGKLSLEEYSHNLSISKVGLSLMMSPHPSYPPLEMAYAGCKVITNAYENKDLSLRSKNITSINSITPSQIAKSIYESCLSPNSAEESENCIINKINMHEGGQGYLNAEQLLSRHFSFFNLLKTQ